jgi:hypothetical protein
VPERHTLKATALRAVQEGLACIRGLEGVDSFNVFKYEWQVKDAELFSELLKFR